MDVNFLIFSSALIREPVEDEPVGCDLINVASPGKALGA